MSSVLLGTSAPVPETGTPGARPPGAPPAPAPVDDRDRGSAVTIIAGVGVLLLAMGVGVLIGRSGAGPRETVAAAPQVITAPATSTGTTAPASAEAAFSDDWPGAKNGYTVQLQTLPVSGTQTSAVAAAKTAASAKGAKAVGALKSDDFSSLKAGSFIVYAGVYDKKTQADKALAGVKHSFPGAKVIHVSSGAAPPSAASTGVSPRVESSLKHPAREKDVEKELKRTGSGQDNAQKSKNLPNVIVTE